MALLEIKHLVKTFNSLRAVDGISFSIERGSCFGLLGPNGAGKTSTVEMLEGISEPDSGDILYQGEPLGRTFRDQAGIMFQSTALQEFITVKETLRLFQHFYADTADLDRLVELCALGEFLHRDTRKLSGGQKQRLLLAIALINNPEILFLDEPTTGLDPQARRNFWQLINNIKRQNKTILLTTHYMEEAYEVCDQIAIMDHGQIIAMGTPRALLAEHFNDVVLQLPGDTDISHIKDMPGVEIIHHNGVLELCTGNLDQAIQGLLARNISLQGLQIRERTLEDLFLELTGKELRA